MKVFGMKVFGNIQLDFLETVGGMNETMHSLQSKELFKGYLQHARGGA